MPPKTKKNSPDSLSLSLCLSLSRSFYKEELWRKGLRIFYRGMGSKVEKTGPDNKKRRRISTFDAVVDTVMQRALKISDRAFLAECRPIVAGWMIKKQRQLLNNKKSPFHHQLKIC